MPLFRALAKNMAPMTNADESPTNRLTLFPIYLSLFIVSTLCPGLAIENIFADWLVDQNIYPLVVVLCVFASNFNILVWNEWI